MDDPGTASCGGGAVLAIAAPENMTASGHWGVIRPNATSPGFRGARNEGPHREGFTCKHAAGAVALALAAVCAATKPKGALAELPPRS